MSNQQVNQSVPKHNDGLQADQFDENILVFDNIFSRGYGFSPQVLTRLPQLPPATSRSIGTPRGTASTTTSTRWSRKLTRNVCWCLQLTMRRLLPDTAARAAVPRDRKQGVSVHRKAGGESPRLFVFGFQVTLRPMTTTMKLDEIAYLQFSNHGV